MLWCNEGNLYRAIFQSKKPEAEQFTDWVTDEVLPALRRTGSYAAARPAPDVSPGGLARLITITRRVMIDMGSTPQDVGQMVQSVFQTWNVAVPPALSKQISGQLSLFDRPAQEVLA